MKTMLCMGITVHQKEVVLECVKRAELRILIRLLSGLGILSAQSNELDKIENFSDFLAKNKYQYTTEEFEWSNELFCETMKQIIEAVNPIAKY